KKLILGVITVIFLIILMVVGGQIVLRFYGEQSERLIVENQEVSVLQDYKLSLIKLQMELKFLAIKNEDSLYKDIISQYEDSQLKFNKCHEFLTAAHKTEIWDNLKEVVKSIDITCRDFKKSNSQLSTTSLLNLKMQVATVLKNLDYLIEETKNEIVESEQISIKAIRHGTITLLAVGVTLILILLIGGIIFINNLTDPIRKLVKGADSIKAGNRQTRVNIHTGDEFEKLADTFNAMLDSLDETTITTEYFKNIINSLYGALFVLNDSGTIQAVNMASIQMFEYSEYEFIDKSIITLVDSHENQITKSGIDQMNFHQKVDFFSNQSVLVTKSGKKIPVVINCTRLKSQRKDNDEILIVAHDITEKVMLEQRVEQNRNEIRLAINEAHETERVRLAKDLHDSLGQQLTGIFFTVQKLSESKEYSKDLVLSILQQIDDSLKETKRLSHNLIPIVLIEFGLITAIQNLIANINKIGKTKFQFFHFDINERLESKMEKTIYRICQEAVSNILKHANAENATIQFLKSVHRFTVLIEDDGIGFKSFNMLTNSIDQNEGIGLLSIRERVNSFNGKITIESEPGAGTEIIIELPLSQ
ncbi:MAG: PAS domain S-box protein, partial [Bacteroidetes bacterium]|nr:PAS domain S-box protein [Bacteroidota bacterium]